MQPAPFHALPGDPPRDARCFWLRADDGIALRAAHWPSREGRGTVLLMQGRTEYLEKYARVADDLNRAGLDVLSIDWRGQGLSDRLIDDGRASHIPDFADYQCDVVEMVVAAQALHLPRHWFLLAHSMGAAIGLAALIDGLPVERVAFSAPMWNINLSPAKAGFARAVTTLARRLGQGRRYVPASGGTESFILASSFNQNLLTTDGATWGRMVAETCAWPEMMLGGVTHDWLHAALRECDRLAALPSPDLPALILLGSREAVVSPAAIHKRVNAWPSATLMALDGARHEPLMERQALRQRALQGVIDHFLAQP